MCDRLDCSRKFGLSRRRYWGSQFCSKECLDLYKAGAPLKQRDSFFEKLTRHWQRFSSLRPGSRPGALTKASPDTLSAPQG